jgi:hypothetical protein
VPSSPTRAHEVATPLFPAPAPGRLEARALLGVYTLAIFTGAFLLFLVQPMFSKMVLPLLGGTPAVWNTCLLFFQTALLAGYLYAHLSARWLRPGRQAALHLLVLAAALLTLPITIGDRWATPGTTHPTLWLLALLTASLGLPFFVLSGSGPLLQKWFSHSRHPDAQNPYFLYAASNLGSMVALLSYPVLVEPRLRLGEQSRLWTLGFALLLALTVLCAGLLWRGRDGASVGVADVVGAAGGAGAAESAITIRRRVRWVLLAFAASSLLLGVTTYITTDIAAVPLLWAIPLALYLLTFVLVFARRQLVPHRLAVRAQPWLVVPAVLLMVWGVRTAATPTFLLHLAAFFVTALVCHGELARDRPPARRLTEFYLLLSLGGALGGAFNTLAAPQLFHSIAEYPLVLALACVAFREQPVRFGLGLGALLAVGLALRPGPDEVLFRDRTFFGTHRVVVRDGGAVHALMHGTTLHGTQRQEPARRLEITTYYHREGPLGQIFEVLRSRTPAGRVGVVGLGTGSMACYGTAGEAWTFFEIDPVVERIAREPHLFTFLRDCAPEVDVVLGDARLTLARRPPGEFDLLVIDAFNSDAIPVHLLTRESLALYLDRLAPGGLLALHVTNRHLELEPVLAGLQWSLGAAALYTWQRPRPNDEGASSASAAMWGVFAREPEDLGELAADPRWRAPVLEAGVRVWTDDFANLLAVFRWR